MNAHGETLRRALEALDMICQNAPIPVALLGPALSGVDPSAWAEDFCIEWALVQCVYRDRCFGGIGGLHQQIFLASG